MTENCRKISRYARREFHLMTESVSYYGTIDGWSFADRRLYGKGRRLRLISAREVTSAERKAYEEG